MVFLVLMHDPPSLHHGKRFPGFLSVNGVLERLNGCIFSYFFLLFYILKSMAPAPRPDREHGSKPHLRESTSRRAQLGLKTGLGERLDS